MTDHHQPADQTARDVIAAGLCNRLSPLPFDRHFDTSAYYDRADIALAALDAAGYAVVRLPEPEDDGVTWLDHRADEVSACDHSTVLLADAGFHSEWSADGAESVALALLAAVREARR